VTVTAKRRRPLAISIRRLALRRVTAQALVVVGFVGLTVAAWSVFVPLGVAIASVGVGMVGLIELGMQSRGRSRR
jgi:hypothetical protein